MKASGKRRPALYAQAHAAHTQPFSNKPAPHPARGQFAPDKSTSVCVAIVYLLPSRLYCRPRTFTGSTVPPPGRHGSRADARVRPRDHRRWGISPRPEGHFRFTRIVLYPNRFDQIARSQQRSIRRTHASSTTAFAFVCLRSSHTSWTVTVFMRSRPRNASTCSMPLTTLPNTVCSPSRCGCG